MSGERAYELALQQVPRNQDGSVNEGELVKAVAAYMDVDVDALKLGLARRVIADKKRSGRTPMAGQLVLPIDDLPPYPYEPGRLVEDDKGNVIENAKARPTFKAAEARRAQRDAEKAQARARRQQEEYAIYAEWAMEQLGKGRPGDEITWDTCVRELHLWKDADPDPESGDDDAEDES